MSGGTIKCWTHEIRDPDCPKCRSETTPADNTPVQADALVERIFVQFSDDSRHIRRWSREPFNGAQIYISIDPVT